MTLALILSSNELDLILENTRSKSAFCHPYFCWFGPLNKEYNTAMSFAFPSWLFIAWEDQHICKFIDITVKNLPSMRFKIRMHLVSHSKTCWCRNSRMITHSFIYCFKLLSICSCVSMIETERPNVHTHTDSRIYTSSLKMEKWSLLLGFWINSGKKLIFITFQVNYEIEMEMTKLFPAKDGGFVYHFWRTLWQWWVCITGRVVQERDLLLT